MEVSELSRSTKIVRGATAAIAAATLLTTYTGHEGERPAGAAVAPAAAKPSKPGSTTPTETVYSYFESPTRNRLLAKVVQSFGAMVLSDSKTSHNIWTPFDTYCYSNNTGADGWTSQGFKPLEGDDCIIQHNPQYGGLDAQVSATVVVGANGEYTNNFITAAVNEPGCEDVVIGYNDLDKYWDSTFEKNNNVSGIEDTQLAPTLKQAKAIDGFAISCLEIAKPEQ